MEAERLTVTKESVWAGDDAMRPRPLRPLQPQGGEMEKLLQVLDDADDGDGDVLRRRHRDWDDGGDGDDARGGDGVHFRDDGDDDDVRHRLLFHLPIHDDVLRLLPLQQLQPRRRPTPSGSWTFLGLSRVVQLRKGKSKVKKPNKAFSHC